jgi:hypothetical protein
MPRTGTVRILIPPKLPIDPWGNPYIYYYPGKHNPTSYDLLSAGPDGKEGTDDDVVNWRGRALDTEARRMLALMHVAQSRAVSEGAPMMLWLDAPAGAYGLAAETSGQNGDPHAETLTVDSTLALAVLNTGTGAQTQFNHLPAIRFQADGTVDESSPSTLKLTDSDGFVRWLAETQLRTGYEISDTAH